MGSALTGLLEGCMASTAGRCRVEVPAALAAPLQDLLKKLLTKSPEERLVMADVLAHPYCA